MTHSKNIFSFVLLFSCFCNSCIPERKQETDETGKFSSSAHLLLKRGTDPWAIRYNGNYFYTQTMHDSIILWITSDLTRLEETTGKTIWLPDNPESSHHLWAPEIHYLHGNWYVYYAADNGNTDNHQIYVLENTNPHPLEGEFVMKGHIPTDSENNWAIDPSVFEHNGELYMVWSGWQTRRIDTEIQCIYIARMSNPWSLSSERVLISKPELSWERKYRNENGWNPSYVVYVNGAPQPLKSPCGKYIHILYSAAASWTPHSSLGMLTAAAHEDLLNPDSWHKSVCPVFTSEPSNRVFGTGYGCFIKSPDEKEDYILYHARDRETDPPGEGDIRSPRIQKFHWDENGYPVLGVPFACKEK